MASAKEQTDDAAQLEGGAEESKAPGHDASRGGGDGHPEAPTQHRELPTVEEEAGEVETGSFRRPKGKPDETPHGAKRARRMRRRKRKPKKHVSAEQRRLEMLAAPPKTRAEAVRRAYRKVEKVEIIEPIKYRVPNDVGGPPVPDMRIEAPAPWASTKERTDFSSDGTYVSRMYSTRGPNLVPTAFRRTAEHQARIRPNVNDLVRERRYGALSDAWRIDGLETGFVTDEVYDKIWQQVRNAFTTGFVTLPLMHLTAVPVPVLNSLSLQLRALSDLNLSDNKLTMIPRPAMEMLSSLKALTLRSNKLVEIDESLKLFTRLTSLDVSLNRLTKLPRAAVTLPNLQTLVASWNRLRFLPVPMKLPKLKRLIVAHNYLEALPDGLAVSRKLEHMDVSFNNMPTLAILPAVEPTKQKEDPVMRPWEWESVYDEALKQHIWYHAPTKTTRRTDPHRDAIKMRTLIVLAEEHAMRTEYVEPVKLSTMKRRASRETVYSITDGLGVGPVGLGGTARTGHVGLGLGTTRTAGSRATARSRGASTPKSRRPKSKRLERPTTAPVHLGSALKQIQEASVHDDRDAVLGGDKGVADDSSPAAFVPTLNMGRVRAYKARKDQAEARAQRQKQEALAKAPGGPKERRSCAKYAVDDDVPKEPETEGKGTEDTAGTQRSGESAREDDPDKTDAAATTEEVSHSEAPAGDAADQFSDVLTRISTTVRTTMKRTLRSDKPEDVAMDYWDKVDAQLEQVGGLTATIDDDMAHHVWAYYVLQALNRLGRSQWQLVQDDETGQVLFRDNVTLNYHTEPPGNVDRLDGMIALRTLNISNNKIVSLPASLARLTSLTDLDADHNKIGVDGFPDAFHELRLKNLSLRYNLCNPIPEHLPLITTLERLLLCGNKMEELPDSIGNLHNLKTLFITENDLVNIPKGLAGCTSLTELHIGLNVRLDHSWVQTLIKGVDHILWRCRQMMREHERGKPPFMPIVAMGAGREARVAKAEADKWVQRDMERALETKSVKVHWKGVKYLPEGAYGVVDLKEMSIIGNAMKHAPYDLNYFSSLTRLHMRSNKLVDFPDDAFETMFQLKELGLEDNQLRMVPPSLTAATALTDIRLDNNRIRELPEDLGFHLVNLEVLSFNFNKVREIPPTIGRLQKLKMLWCNHNRLEGIPVSMSFNKALRSLRLDGNRIEVVPRVLTHIALRELTLANNQLDELPRYITVAPVLKTSLKKLWLQSNRITEVNATLFQLEALKEFSVDVNPLRSPPRAVSAGGLGAVLEYARIRDQHIHDIMEEAAAAQIILRERNMFPKCEMIVTGGIGHLLEEDLDEFDDEVDAYVNGMCHQCPLAAKDITSALERRRFQRADEVRFDLIAKFRRVCEAIQRFKWVPDHSFSARVVRPWGPDKTPVTCFAITAEALFGPSGNIDPGCAVDRANQKASTLFRGLGGPPLTMLALLDALRNYRTARGGQVGCPVDTVDFAMMAQDAEDERQAEIEARNELAGRVERMTDEEKAAALKACLLKPNADGVYEMRKANTKTALVVQRVHWSKEDFEHYDEEKELLAVVKTDIEEDSELLYKTKAGVDLVKKRIKLERKILKKKLKELQPQLKQAKREMEAANKTAAKLVLRRQAFVRGESITVHRWDNEDDMEDEVGAALEDLDLLADDYRRLKEQVDPLVERKKLKKKQFKEVVEKEITAERANRIREKAIDARRIASLKAGIRRPWDGVDGKDFAKWKNACKHERDENGDMQIITPLMQEERAKKERAAEEEKNRVS